MSWNITFSEPVFELKPSNFAVVASGLVGAYVTSTMGSGTNWTVTAFAGCGSGTLGLNLVSKTGFGDVVGNYLGNAVPYVGPTYAVNDRLPTAAVTVNDGSIQRSRVNSLTVTFSKPMQLGSIAGAFQLMHQGVGSVPLTVDTSASTPQASIITLTWSGAGIESGSLPDGDYVLTIIASQALDLAGQQLDGNGDGTGGDNGTFSFFRFFGDANGDRTVSASDFIQFRQFFGGSSFMFDFDGDGAVAASDFIQFRLRFGGSLP